MASQPIPITSIDDTRIEAFRDVRDRDLYGREGVFVAESEPVIRRLLHKPQRFVSLLMTPARYESMRDGLAVLPDDVPIYTIDLDMMCGVAGFHIHRGALAIARRPSDAELSVDAVLGPLKASSKLRLLLAEGITNVDNMGGLFRNAAGFGIDAIVLDPTCCDPLYRKSVRVSMGHVLSVPYAKSAAWQADMVKIKQQWGITLIGAEHCEGSRPLWEVPHPAKWGVLVGSEGTGISAQSLQECDFVARIPMFREVPSLNVATAAAVVLYEMSRTS